MSEQSYDPVRQLIKMGKERGYLLYDEVNNMLPAKGQSREQIDEQDVNILAYQQFPHEKDKGSVRLVVDNSDKTRATLDRQRSDYTETKVAKVTLANRPGQLARVASRLGNEGININYGYSGVEPGASASFLILGVADAGKAVKLLEQAAATGATT